MNDGIRSINRGIDLNMKYRPLVVAVMSGKGGVGKTVVSYNLAYNTASEGCRTLLIDADWNFGDLHIHANISPVASLADAVDGTMTFDEVITEINDNLHLIASPAVKEIDRGFDKDRLTDFFAGIRVTASQYGYVIIDTSPAGLDILIPIAGTADINFLVLVPELTSIADTYGLFKYLVGSVGNMSAAVIVNRAESSNDAEYITGKLSYLTDKFLGTPLSGGTYIPEDRQVRRALAAQKPLLIAAPESPAARGLVELHKLLLQGQLRGSIRQAIIEPADINDETIVADIKE